MLFFIRVIFFKKFIYFIYLFLAALGLHCCARAFSSCGERGLLFVVVHRLLIAVASLVVEHGLQARGLSSCDLWALECRPSSRGARAQLLCGMWDLPKPGLQPVFPALAGGFLTTAPPGKSWGDLFVVNFHFYCTEVTEYDFCGRNIWNMLIFPWWLRYDHYLK